MYKIETVLILNSLICIILKDVLKMYRMYNIDNYFPLLEPVYMAGCHMMCIFPCSCYHPVSHLYLSSLAQNINQNQEQWHNLNLQLGSLCLPLISFSVVNKM